MLQMKSRLFWFDLGVFSESIIKHLPARHCIGYIAKPSLYKEESYYLYES